MDSTKTPGLSPKLKKAKWTGPCIIERTLSDLLFVLRLKQRGKSKVLHHDRLKRYLSDDVPPWMADMQILLLEKSAVEPAVRIPDTRDPQTISTSSDDLPSQPPKVDHRPLSSTVPSNTAPTTIRSQRTTRTPARFLTYGSPLHI